MTRVAVVIPTFNGAALLRMCLDELIAHPPQTCELTIVIADDGSSDDTESVVPQRSDLIYHRNERNLGFARTCNAGAAAAGPQDHLVFLNNDTLPLPGWLDALVREADEHPEAAAIGAKLLFPNGTVQHAGVAIGEDRWPHHIYAGFPSDHAAVSHSRDMVAVTAACMLVRRQAFDDLGGFDADFHNGYEDIDLCLRLGADGHAVRYCAASVVYHFESVTRWPGERKESTEANDRLYAERWADRVDPDDIRHYIEDGLLGFEYSAYYPLELSLSPHLATVARADSPSDLEGLLADRSTQVMELLGKVTRMQIERSRVATPSLKDVALAASAPPQPRVLARGTFRPLGAGVARHRVSILVPVKDGADELRELLPLVLGQHAPAEIEIVAVDSGSTDDSIDVLREFGATVLAIEPAAFDHGLTRNLAAHEARGDVLVFLTQRSRPDARDWLAPLLSTLDSSETIAGVCSRVLPREDADGLTARLAEREVSGSATRTVKQIEDWAAYQQLSADERRELLNFHTVGAAIRAEVFERFPFRRVRTIGEDLLWSREVLEQGYSLVHEPASIVRHSHDYSLAEWFARNVDDGVANRDIVDRRLDALDVLPMIRGMVAADWALLRAQQEDGDLDDLLIEAAIRRVAQVAGQWVGANHLSLTDEMVGALSRVERARSARSAFG